MIQKIIQWLKKERFIRPEKVSLDIGSELEAEVMKLDAKQKYLDKRLDILSSDLKDLEYDKAGKEKVLKEFGGKDAIEKLDLLFRHIELLHVITRCLYHSRRTHITTPVSKDEADTLDSIYKHKTFKDSNLI